MSLPSALSLAAKLEEIGHSVEIVTPKKIGFWYEEVNQLLSNSRRNKLSVGFPHGNVPIPHFKGCRGNSVLGVWEGLKVETGFL